MKDAFDTEIQPDDVVVHANRSGSRLSLKKVKITAVEENSISGYHLTPTQRRTTLTTPSNLCILKTPQDEQQEDDNNAPIPTRM